MGSDAVVLLSGGLDSTTVLAYALQEGRRCHALSFAYGQRHAVELDAAKRVAAALGAYRHLIAEIDLGVFGHSALTADIAVPHFGAGQEPPMGIPATYVPARNTIFLAYALALAETTGAGEIFIGVNALDYSGYPDCRPAYIEAFQVMANLATKAAVEEGSRVSIRAPLISLTKAEIISLGLTLGVDYSITHSCYDPLPGGAPCGTCDSCHLRARGFAALGREDPALAARRRA
ncbi:MAG: 7-cyano-7-deazaguanine synthase QueC [Actinomycetota bacterium]|nr:7-cyano-7-deazaguanine synthase QueC [Actinomycetota bacterium]